jgi:hypothetical protein
MNAVLHLIYDSESSGISPIDKPTHIQLWRLDAERQADVLVWGRDLDAGAIVRITNLEPAEYRLYDNQGDSTPGDSKVLSEVIAVNTGKVYAIEWTIDALEGGSAETAGIE